MSEIIIRPVIRADAETLFALRLEALQNNPEAFGANYEDTIQRWTAETYAASRVPDTESDDVIFCAERDGDLLGMMGFYRDTYPKGRHNGNIWGVYTKASVRGQGIGRKLLEALLDHACNCDGLAVVTLSVVTENSAAIKLYQSCGFTIWGTQPDALRDANKSYAMHWMSYEISTQAL